MKLVFFIQTLTLYLKFYRFITYTCMLRFFAITCIYEYNNVILYLHCSFCHMTFPCSKESSPTCSLEWIFQRQTTAILRRP